MAFIIGKKQDGKTYYYLAESARVGGKPRIVSQRYLGSAEEIAARLSERGPGEPDRTRHLAFGDLAAVWAMLERLCVAEIVDEVVGARRADAQASIGTYIALAVANRLVDPCSKLAFSKWWAKTTGDRWVRLPAAAFDHRRFWDAMDVISEERLREIERRIVTHMVEVFDVDLSGLGLVVSTDGGIPLVSHAYPGDRPDVTQFPEMVTELVTRFGAIAEAAGELTLVSDAGQDSKDNQQLIEGSPLHFVGSLPPADYPDLLAAPKRRYKVVDQARFPGLSAFQTRKVVFGHQRRLVVTHSQNLHDKQARGFDQTLGKARRQLAELAARLARGKTRKPRQKVEAEIAAILKPRWLSRVISTSLSGESPTKLRLSWRTKQKASAELEEELFGKRILFTDRDEWPVAMVVGGYRSQFEVEADFRQMKDPDIVSFSPMFHWTDQKIRVHGFYCVVALMVARLIRREAQRAGVSMSVGELLQTLGGIQETVLLYQGERGRPRARRMLTEIDPTQRRLYDLFGLDAYAPKR